MYGHSRERQITPQTIKAAKKHLVEQREEYERTRIPPPGPGDIPLRGTPEWDLREYEREKHGNACICYGPVPYDDKESRRTYRHEYMHKLAWMEVNNR